MDAPDYIREQIARLQAAFEGCGLTYEQLSARTEGKLLASTAHYVLTGKTQEPRWTTLALLCQALDVAMVQEKAPAAQARAGKVSNR